MAPRQTAIAGHSSVRKFVMAYSSDGCFRKEQCSVANTLLFSIRGKAMVVVRPASMSGCGTASGKQRARSVMITGLRPAMALPATVFEASAGRTGDRELTTAPSADVK